MIHLETEPDDAGDFILNLNRILIGVCEAHQPHELILIRIDNWFGPKWLRFSGKLHGAVGYWSKRLTLPPFVPARVVWQRRYQLGEPDTYELIDPEPLLHVQKALAENQRPLAEKISVNTALVWFSSATSVNGRGALMAYLPDGADWWAWYAGYAKTNAWEATTLKGISRQELSAFGKPLA